MYAIFMHLYHIIYIIVFISRWLKIAKGGSKQKMPLKGDDREVVEVLQEKLASAVQRKETAKTTEEKLAAALQVEEARAALKKDQGRRFEEKHMFKTNASADTIKARIDKWTEDIERLELDIRSRDENKEVALGTSKINYMDPRISVAWCKRCEVPIDKIFPKTLRDKFNWAMAVPGTWKFE
jgi:DNA topoisomerase-1